MRSQHSDDEDICENYHGGNPESEEANFRTTPNKSRDRSHIFGILNQYPEGLTCDELEILTGLSHQTCSARCSEMLRDWIIVRKPLGRSYERRPTRTGTNAAVYILNHGKVVQGELF